MGFLSNLAKTLVQNAGNWTVWQCSKCNEEQKELMLKDARGNYVVPPAGSCPCGGGHAWVYIGNRF